ncbi:type VII secretion target [Actinoplanes sp. NPDC023714]|uniref:type VII secretion target n=1 Tax=Actinoplanes sp. NPDC023714 TaxID=3154322 RepID=UPI0033FA36FD
MRADPDDLRRHASHLDGVLARARFAGDDTRMTADAYGHLCVIVPILLEQVRTPLIEAIETAARAVGDSAEAVRRAADDYEHTDGTNATDLSGRVP